MHMDKITPTHTHCVSLCVLYIYIYIYIYVSCHVRYYIYIYIYLYMSLCVCVCFHVLISRQFCSVARKACPGRSLPEERSSCAEPWLRVRARSEWLRTSGSCLGSSLFFWAPFKVTTNSTAPFEKDTDLGNYPSVDRSHLRSPVALQAQHVFSQLSSPAVALCQFP